jgi:hypothetical protein
VLVGTWGEDMAGENEKTLGGGQQQLDGLIALEPVARTLPERDAPPKGGRWRQAVESELRKRHVANQSPAVAKSAP